MKRRYILLLFVLGVGVTLWSKEKPNIVLIYADDFGESSNLAAKNPKQVGMMKDLLEKRIVQGRSTPGPKQKNASRLCAIQNNDVKIRKLKQTKDQ